MTQTKEIINNQISNFHWWHHPEDVCGECEQRLEENSEASANELASDNESLSSSVRDILQSEHNYVVRSFDSQFLERVSVICDSPEKESSQLAALSHSVSLIRQQVQGRLRGGLSINQIERGIITASPTPETSPRASQPLSDSQDMIGADRLGEIPDAADEEEEISVSDSMSISDEEEDVPDFVTGRRNAISPQNEAGSDLVRFISQIPYFLVRNSIHGGPSDAQVANGIRGPSPTPILSSQDAPSALDPQEPFHID